MTVEELELQLTETKKINKELEAEKSQLEKDKIILEEKVDYLIRKLYGTKSEKISTDNTPDLFNEAE